MKTEEVLKEVLEERYRQEQKWGEQNHIPADYLMILGEEVGEANKAALESKFTGSPLSDYRKELVQVAAVAVAMIECYDRNKFGFVELKVPAFDPNNCSICGHMKTIIRGRHPGDDERSICPQCAFERLEDVNMISSSNYGQAYETKQQEK